MTYPKSTSYDEQTLIKALTLANIFHGNNFSALITNLVNKEYIKDRDLITDENIKEAKEIFNKIKNKSKNKSGTSEDNDSNKGNDNKYKDKSNNHEYDNIKYKENEVKESKGNNDNESSLLANLTPELKAQLLELLKSKPAIKNQDKSDIGGLNPAAEASIDSLLGNR